MEKLCDFFTLRPHLITTLTYVIMDNFYPCFIVIFFFFSNAILQCIFRDAKS